jgi:small subunit ribosomal protein S4e
MSKHLKRLAAPRAWSIQRKKYVWVTRPRAGPHPLERSIPLLILLRDFLHHANTAREAKKIIAKGEILVDCKKVKDHKRPVGLMDTISIPKLQEYYRMLLDAKGKLRLVKIPLEKASWKLVRIENKTTVRGGRTQLNLHDGRNILLENPKYKTGDTLKIELPSQKILEHYPLEKNSLGLVIGGKHSGKIAKIISYEITRASQPNLVKLEGFSTVKHNIFVIGSESSEIILPGVLSSE